MTEVLCGLVLTFVAVVALVIVALLVPAKGRRP
jgi:hypothetical protein